MQRAKMVLWTWLVTLSACCGDLRGNRQQLTGHLTLAMATAPDVGRVDGTSELRLAIGLPLRDSETLERHLAAVSDPKSAEYQRYLSPEEFTAAYGPSEADYQAVIAWAKRQGLEVVSTFPNRLAVDVRGRADRIERALGLELHQHLRSDGTRFFAPDREPSLALETPVLHITGLDDRARPRLAGGSGPSGNHWGTDFRNIYVPCTSLTGSGQRIGVVSTGGYTASDVTAYEDRTGLPHVPLRNIHVDNGTDAPLAPEYARETTADIELAISMAPGLAEVVVFEGPGNGPPTTNNDELIAMAVTQPLANVLSLSQNAQTLDANALQIMQELALQGQTLLIASGDDGARVATTNDFRAAATITVVGGTYDVKGASSFAETSDYQGGGGYMGPSGGYAGAPIPAYQQSIDMSKNGGSTAWRNFPDISMLADDIEIVYNGVPDGFAGTSASAPLFAGLVALANQQSQLSGRGPVGFLNPALYGLAHTAYSANFNDIQDGSTNGGSTTHTAGFPAVAGYDLSTGLGSPTCALVNQLATLGLPSTPPRSGFKTIGGTQNLCLAVAGNNIVASAQLVSATCNGQPSQAWTINAQNAISPQTNPSLCIEGNLSNGSVWLAACNGSGTQSFSVSGNLISNANGMFDHCLDVPGGSNASGTPIDLVACNHLPQQAFWPWGFPLVLARDVSGLCLSAPANGAQLSDAVCRPNPGNPPLLTEVFTFTADNRVTTQSGDCLNVDGLNSAGFSTLSMQPCLGSANQSWTLAPGGTHSGRSDWSNMVSAVRGPLQCSFGHGCTFAHECVDVNGNNPNAGAQVDTYECNNSDAQVWNLSLLPWDYGGSTGY